MSSLYRCISRLFQCCKGMQTQMHGTVFSSSPDIRSNSKFSFRQRSSLPLMHHPAADDLLPKFLVWFHTTRNFLARTWTGNEDLSLILLLQKGHIGEASSERTQFIIYVTSCVLLSGIEFTLLDSLSVKVSIVSSVKPASGMGRGILNPCEPASASLRYFKRYWIIQGHAIVFVHLLACSATMSVSPSVTSLTIAMKSR